jgi:hypothetical protein
MRCGPASTGSTRVPVKFPGLKVVMSGSGISWVPTIQERLRRNMRMAGSDGSTWVGIDETPEEVFNRAFSFTSIEDPSGLASRDLIGVGPIMLEVDYPHPDSSWPDTQTIVGSELRMRVFPSTVAHCIPLLAILGSRCRVKASTAS